MTHRPGEKEPMKIVGVSAIPMSAPVPKEKRHRTDLGTKGKSDATLIRFETDNGAHRHRLVSRYAADRLIHRHLRAPAAKGGWGARGGFAAGNGVRGERAARRGLGPEGELMIDAHGSLEVATAIKLARELEPYDIAWFEEPVSPDDHAGQAEVRRSTTIPIASGEREFTRFDFQDLLDRRALDIAQPDVARAGGMTEIRRIAAVTSAHGVRLAPHAWGRGVRFAASIHVAMAAPNCHILEVSQGYMPMMWDLFNEPFDIRPDGMVHAPDRPGLGFTLRPDTLERFRSVDGPEYKF